MVGRGDGIGSNSWVVGPKRSSTGKPLLANDPHLGVGIPGIWYQTGLHCRSVSPACPFDVTGFSFAGLPGIVIGHNQSIAWGFTNLGPDVSDFYLEQLSGDSYRRGKSYLPLKQHTETIKVAGGQDVTTTVRETVHGPLLSDVIPSVAQAGRTALVEGKAETTSYAVSLAWTGLLPGHTADAIFKINTAQNFAQFRDAARDFAVPAQNLLYADTQGHIGYQAPGQVPIRASSTTGAPPGYWPAPGWDPRYDWTGFVPFEQMPTAYDPPEGLHRGRQPGRDRQLDPVPDHRVGLRLSKRTHPHPDHGDAQGHAGADVPDPGRHPQRVRARAGQGAAGGQAHRPVHRGGAGPPAHLGLHPAQRPVTVGGRRGVLQRGVEQHPAADLQRRARRPEGRRRLAVDAGSLPAAGRAA